MIVIRNKVEIPQKKMKNINKHMNLVSWNQQFNNCSYPRISHTSSDDLSSDLTTI